MNRNIPEAMLIILGAGASHDCLPAGVSPATDRTFISGTVLGGTTLGEMRPPLTQQLAQARPLMNWATKRWEWSTPVVSYLRRELTKSDKTSGHDEVLTVERALRVYEDGASQDPDRQRHLMAMRFYLRDLLAVCTDVVHSHELHGEDTNHVALITRALEWSGRREQRTVTFVSFNYDMILERAMTAYWGFDPLQLSAYLSHPRAKLLKPHGSVAWHWRLASQGRQVGGSTRDQGLYAIDSAVTDGVDTSQLVLQRIDYRAINAAAASQAYLVPALALPFDNKADFVWPEDQRLALESLQGTVTRLLTVGWRGLEAHFSPMLTPLVKQYGRALVVAGGADGAREAQEVANRLQLVLPHVRASAWREYGRGFTEVLRDTDEIEWFFQEGESA